MIKSYSDTNLSSFSETKISRFKVGNSSMRLKGEANFNLNFLNSTDRDRTYNFNDAKLEILNSNTDNFDVNNEIPPPYTSLTHDKNIGYHDGRLKKFSSDTNVTSVKLRDSFKKPIERSSQKIHDKTKNPKKIPNQIMSTKSIFENLYGCFRPIMKLWSVKSSSNSNGQNRDDYNIPFEELKNLIYIGNGAQGCVFKGMYNKEEVAIKKVKSKEEADIKHLKKLNHENLVKFKGVSMNGDKFFCIIMEYCPYGQLFEYLKNRNLLQPSFMVDLAKQIANGMNYLHINKFIHRDLKSPNILFFRDNQLKITDFGACKNITDTSTIMSFKGTVAWMAPELIRNEACSEKVDVYSYGVVLWELLTCEIPYKNLDQNSIMWGVGSNKLRLTIPNSAPDGIKILLQQCFAKPKNRPGFNVIIKHLEILENSEEMIQLEQDFKDNKLKWKEEIQEILQVCKHKNTRKGIKIGNFNDYNENEENKRKIDEELKHINDIKEFYEKKIENLNNMHLDLANLTLQLDERERNIIKREKELNIRSKKRIVGLLLKKDFQNKKKSLQHESELISKSSPQNQPSGIEMFEFNSKVSSPSQDVTFHKQFKSKYSFSKNIINLIHLNIDYLAYKNKSKLFKVKSNYPFSMVYSKRKSIYSNRNEQNVMDDLQSINKNTIKLVTSINRLSIRRSLKISSYSRTKLRRRIDFFLNFDNQKVNIQINKMI